MKFKPFKYLIVVGVSVLGLSSLVQAEKIDYTKDASKYQQLCSRKSSFNANKEECTGYENYLNDLKDKANNAQNKIKQSIKDNKGDITKTLDVIKANNNLIDSTDKQIAITESAIKNYHKEIKRLEADILDRMSLSQEINTENFIIDFLTQSLNLNDFFTRLSGITAINDSNRESSEDLADQKQKLELAEKELKVNKDVLKQAKASQETLLKDYRSNEAKLYEKLESERIKQESYNEELDNLNLADLENELNNAKPETSTPETKPETSAPETSSPETSAPETSTPETSKPTSSAQLSIPVKSATVTAAAWYYPASFGGGWHPGIDLANDSGTKVYSPGKGVELTRGYDAYGYGNYIATAHQVGNDTYTLIYAHLQSYAAKSATLENGTLLGYMGSTGNSTGPHTHVEIFKHANTTLSQVVNTFKNNRDISFGVGYNGTNNGKVVRLKPHEYWGLSYYESY